MKPLLSLLSLTLLALPVAAQHTLVVSGGKNDLSNVPIRVAVKGVKDGPVVGILEGGKRIALGQLTLAGPRDGARELVFILPELKAGSTRTLTIEPLKDFKGDSFSWVKDSGDYADLRYGGKPVLRYMHAKFDESSKEKRDRTYKVFHHLWDPDGKRLVTNGGQTDPHTDPKKLTFPHHRGLMFAFNKCTYGDKKMADTWHCTGDAHQTHEGFLRESAGPVFAAHAVRVDWHGVKKEVFAEETRQMTVYHVPGGALVEADITLKTTGGPVHLDGDPQHAGFQFRASNDVVTQGHAKATYYLRPDGKGKPGETRNWEPKKGGPVDLPWKVLSFVLDGQRYSVAYIDHPANPGEKRHSERDYGRFGCYFVYDLTKDNPLHLRYRIWLQKGEMTGDQAQALRDAFVDPPRMTVK